MEFVKMHGAGNDFVVSAGKSGQHQHRICGVDRFAENSAIQCHNSVGSDEEAAIACFSNCIGFFTGEAYDVVGRHFPR